jgi:hypothetical protein
VHRVCSRAVFVGQRSNVDFHVHRVRSRAVLLWQWGGGMHPMHSRAVLLEQWGGGMHLVRSRAVLPEEWNAGMYFVCSRALLAQRNDCMCDVGKRGQRHRTLAPARLRRLCRVAGSLPERCV